MVIIGADDATGSPVFPSSLGRGIGVKLPALVQALGKLGKPVGRRRAGHDGDDQRRATGFAKLVDLAAAGQDGVVQVWREIDGIVT